MTREPLRLIAAITAAVTAILAALVAFGLDIDSDQQAAILGIVTAVIAPAAVAVLTRPKVTPVATPRADTGTPLVPYPADDAEMYRDPDL